MKISNFNLVSVTGRSPIDWKFKATIDVTTGLIFKKTETRMIAKDYAGSWFFVDNGKFCPGQVTDELARAYEAQNGAYLQHIKPS